MKTNRVPCMNSTLKDKPMKTTMSARASIGRLSPGLAAMALLAGIRATAVAYPTEEQATGTFANITVAPVTAAWKYSNDGGKTFVAQPLPGPPAQAKPHKKEFTYPFVWQGEFQIADPAKIGGLWVRIFDQRADGKPSAAAICNGDISVACCGYPVDDLQPFNDLLFYTICSGQAAGSAAR